MPDKRPLFQIGGRVKELSVSDILQTTGVTETVVISSFTSFIRQTASGITTSLSGFVAGARLDIHNASTGSNVIDLTINGIVSPTIRKKDTFSLFYTGTEWILT